jgi:hypothetical protein
MQEYSSLGAVGESEVGGQCFTLERCYYWGITLSLTAIGVVRMTRCGPVHEVPEVQIEGLPGGRGLLVEQKC